MNNEWNDMTYGLVVMWCVVITILFIIYIGEKKEQAWRAEVASWD
jgi:hypothetical protein